VLRKAGRLREASLSRRRLLAEVQDADALFLRFSHRIDEDIFRAAPRLRAVATNATGTDHIDARAAARHGVAVLSLKGETPFLRTIHATAEHTWGLLLALVRRLPAAADDVRAGRWRRDLFLGRELAGKRLGIVGFGRIGEKIARYGRAFGMDVHAHSKGPAPRAVGVRFHRSLGSLLKISDVLTLHVPLAPDTVGLIGRSELTRLPKGALVLNTSRGAVMDEPALLRALRSGRVAGAALDVLAGEGKSKFPKGNALAAHARRHDNLIITPHIGGATMESWAKTEVFMARKLARYLSGKKK